MKLLCSSKGIDSEQSLFSSKMENAWGRMQTSKRESVTVSHEKGNRILHIIGLQNLESENESENR